MASTPSSEYSYVKITIKKECSASQQQQLQCTRSCAYAVASPTPIYRIDAFSNVVLSSLLIQYLPPFKRALHSSLIACCWTWSSLSKCFAANHSCRHEEVVQYRSKFCSNQNKVSSNPLLVDETAALPESAHATLVDPVEKVDAKSFSPDSGSADNDSAKNSNDSTTASSISIFGGLPGLKTTIAGAALAESLDSESSRGNGGEHVSGGALEDASWQDRYKRVIAFSFSYHRLLIRLADRTFYQVIEVKISRVQ